MDTKTVEVNGMRISYTVAGTGTPLLYVHGNTGSKLWYKKVMEVDGLRTVAPDLPNFGDSDRIEIADIDVYADYLRDFVRRMEFSTPLPVLGHSLVITRLATISLTMTGLSHQSTSFQARSAFTVRGFSTSERA